MVLVVVTFCVYVVIVNWLTVNTCVVCGTVGVVCNDCIFHYPVNAVGLHSEHSTVLDSGHIIVSSQYRTEIKIGTGTKIIAAVEL